MTDIKQVYEAILTEADKDTIVSIPLKDLIWTIVVFSQQMSDCEQEAFGDSYPRMQPGMTQEEVDSIISQREYLACRRDELARLITQYTDYDTSKIWSEVIKLFKDYKGVKS